MTTIIQTEARIAAQRPAGRSRATSAVLLGLVASVLVLSGCASGRTGVTRDPWEKFNRGVYSFNDAVDSAVLKPVATAYVNVTPPLVRTGVSNFMGNLGDLWSGVNSVFQLKGQNALENFFRFGINSTVGLFGVLDIASEMNLERHKEDFGQTLGRWGVGTGPYLVLPFFGPSTLRDAAAMTLDTEGNLITHIDPHSARNTLYVLKAVDARANVLRAGSVLDQAALDKYTFSRDVYLQYRRAEIFDGNPPEAPLPPVPPNPAAGSAAPADAAANPAAAASAPR
ncbi:MAG: VacJ family lipoprotein [Burkholderiales bacterium]|nr:MAG: VacJ family lipoprotein [Burkholderiales bacterium]